MGELRRLTAEDLEAERVLPLPTKEVISLLDLNVDLDLALDLAAPIDLAVAANLNVAAPIDAAVSANVLSFDSTAQALAAQQTAITQTVTGDAIATAPQTALVDQTGDGGTGTGDVQAAALDGGTGDALSGTGSQLGSTLDGAREVVTEGSAADVFSGGALLNVDVNAALDAAISAPIAGAVAANGNVAAPIDAAVAANVLSFDSSATAVANQTAVITQSLDDVTASATAAQDATVLQ
jgi:hypothetical protein